MEHIANKPMYVQTHAEKDKMQKDAYRRKEKINREE